MSLSLLLPLLLLFLFLLALLSFAGLLPGLEVRWRAVWFLDGGRRRACHIVVLRGMTEEKSMGIM